MIQSVLNAKQMICGRNYI